MHRRPTRNSPEQRSRERLRRARRLPALAFAASVALSAGGPVCAHDLERTRVSLTFARDGSYVLDVTNDLNWLTLRLDRFAPGRHDLAALGHVFRDRVVLFVDGREERPTSVELLPLASPPVSSDEPVLATYRLRGRMPPVVHTLRWYYGLVIDPYPLTLQRADGRLVTEVVYGDAWSRTLDIGGQFERAWLPPTIARQLPVAIMVGMFAAALGYRILRSACPLW